MVIGIDGMPWASDGNDEDAVLTDSVTASIARGHDLHRLVLTLSDWLRAPTRGADTVLEGNPVRRADGTDALGLQASVFVSTTGLPAGFRFTNATSRGAEAITVVLGDWRATGRLRLFRAATFLHGTDRYEYRFTHLSAQRSPPPSVAAPKQVRTLVAARSADLRRLLELHNEGRRAHLDYDPALQVSSFSHDFTTVSKGEVSRPSRAESVQRFSRYLAASRFLQWDDIQPPTVRISLDGSMAHVTVHKRVRIAPRQAAADSSHTVFAWTALYENRAGEWRLVTVTSTDRPGRPEEIAPR